MNRTYERHLPHRVPEGFPIFLTWNLKGAFPVEAIERLQDERKRLEDTPSRLGETSADRAVRIDKILFAISDRVLDSAERGPRLLSDPAAAKIVEDAILFGSEQRYELFAWCVLSNHVHTVLTPKWELARIMQGIKGYTAHQLNRRDNQRGRVVWQDESYDHWARDEGEFYRIIAYVENNPVAANLCSLPEEWPFSSARFRRLWKIGTPWRRPRTSAFPG